MTKESFKLILQKLLKYQVGAKTAPCRCVDCCNEKQKNQDTPESTS